jgi:hypothetical protein
VCTHLFDFSFVFVSQMHCLLIYLASQASPAVGRALAIPLAVHLQKESFFPKVCEIAIYRHRHAVLSFAKLNCLFVFACTLQDSVSVMSLGEGSTNNAHFLAVSPFTSHSCSLHD